MTNTFALWLGGLIVLVFAVDGLIYGWAMTVFAMRLLADLIGWLAVWR